MKFYKSYLEIQDRVKQYYILILEKGTYILFYSQMSRRDPS